LLEHVSERVTVVDGGLPLAWPRRVVEPRRLNRVIDG
jgi:hypothetical protein